MNAPTVHSITPSSPITPAEPLPPLPAIPRGSLVIAEGRAPIWRYGMALHKLHALACGSDSVDPRLAAVVVATHSPGWTLGKVVDVTLPVER